MKILLSGSKGFIGRNIKRYYSRKGHEIVEIDKDVINLGNDEMMACHRLQFVNELMKGCDLVIHCAGLADVRHSHEQTQQQFEDNVVSTKTILDSMVTYGVKQIIYLSTAIVNCSGCKWFNANVGDYVTDVQVKMISISRNQFMVR